MYTINLHRTVLFRQNTCLGRLDIHRNFIRLDQCNNIILFDHLTDLCRPFYDCSLRV